MKNKCYTHRSYSRHSIQRVSIDSGHYSWLFLSLAFHHVGWSGVLEEVVQGQREGGEVVRHSPAQRLPGGTVCDVSDA